MFFSDRAGCFEVAEGDIDDDLAMRPVEQLGPEHVPRNERKIIVQRLDRA